MHHMKYEISKVMKKSFLCQSAFESSSWNRNLMWEFDGYSAHTVIRRCHLPVATNPSPRQRRRQSTIQQSAFSIPKLKAEPNKTEA